MNKVCLGLCVMAVVAMMGAAVAADDPIVGMGPEMTEAAAKGDYQTARLHAHHILDMAQKTAADALGPQGLYLVALAHYYVAGEMLDQAIKTGKLTDEQQAQAEKLLAQIAPTLTATETVPKLRVIGKGETVNLEEYLVAGKTTIVDFYSDYCGPCRTLAPRLEELANRRDDIYVVKVDINRPGQVGIDWGSPVARQFELRSLPHLKIYGADKQLVAEGRPASAQVLDWCEAQ